jgi:hypothetical protein
MSTVQKLSKAVQYLQQKHIPKAKARRFELGVQSFSLSEFSSLNAAGRKLGINRFTGENRIRRLVSDIGLAHRIQQLLVTESLVGKTGYWYCSLDHSQFGSFCIAVLAVSHRQGRAIPIWCQINVSEAGLIMPLLAALEELFAYLAEHAPKLQLVLVMDRWFASDKLFESYNVYFIARTKSDKRVQLPWDPSWWRVPIQEISLLETNATYRSHHLRLVRSVMKPGMKDPEPWFLLTNLPIEITRTMVLHRYAERFEIEEAFKDIKWLQRLEWQRIRRQASIQSLLMFVFLGWWLLWRYGTIPTKLKVHPKKKLSWFRHAWEQLQAELHKPYWLLT